MVQKRTRRLEAPPRRALHTARITKGTHSTELHLKVVGEAGTIDVIANALDMLEMLRAAHDRGDGILHLTLRLQPEDVSDLLDNAAARVKVRTLVSVK